MRLAIRLASAVFLTAVLLAGSACRLTGGTASSSPQASSSSKVSPSPTSSSKLDAEVPMPAGFPPDVPIYTGARLTAGAAFAANGVTTWGMEWETLDTVDKVQAFYATKLSQGDWTIQFSGNANGSFSAVFSRKSNPKFAGIVGADGSSGVTKISLSLASG
ncbi:MAG: hypothetical protein ACYDA0_04835 [Candidatus Dormibacteraceae bacterium]